MKVKYETETDSFFKIWTSGNHRIMLDKADTSYRSYQVQQFNGKCWISVCNYHTLKAAKECVGIMKMMEVA